MLILRKNKKIKKLMEEKLLENNNWGYVGYRIDEERSAKAQT